MPADEHPAVHDSPSMTACAREVPGGTATDELARALGQRVRAVRKRQRMSRAALAERAAVSARYLAQLESGEGNTSLALLHRVSTALDEPVDRLLATSDPLDDETTRLVTLYQRSDAATRARALRLLDPGGLIEQKAARLCLIGLRGAGKSTLGALLGKSLNMPFIELNRDIERVAGMPVGEIIALYGHQGYRRLERDTLDDIVSTHTRLILAVGGGVVEEPGTHAQVLNRFHTVWLHASAEEHMARVRAQGDLRPMAGNPEAMTQLREMLAARESRYREADYHLDTSARSVEHSLEELQQLVRVAPLAPEAVQA